MNRITPIVRCLLLLCAILLAACGSSAPGAAAPTITLTTTEFRFNPNALTLKAGEPTTILLKNTGQTLHDFTIVSGPGIPTPEPHTGADHINERRSYHIAADSNREAQLIVTLAPGAYEFICSVEAHATLGMKGTLTVQSAP